MTSGETYTLPTHTSLSHSASGHAVNLGQTGAVAKTLERCSTTALASLLKTVRIQMHGTRRNDMAFLLLMLMTPVGQ